MSNTVLLGALAAAIEADTSNFTQGMTKASTDLDKLESKITKMGSSLSSFGTKVSSAGTKMMATVTAPLVGLSTYAVKLASDADETRGKFEVVFSAVKKQADEVAANLHANYGLATSSAQDMLVTTGNLLRGMGFSSKETVNLAQQVSVLGADLAAFSNYSGGAAGASELLARALVGQTRAARALGIVIRDEEVTARVARMTAQGMIFESERQAKAYATLAIISEKGRNALGSYAREQGSIAMRSRKLAEDMKTLSETWGAFLINVLRLPEVIAKVSEKINQLTNWFSSLSDSQKKNILIWLAIAAGIGPVLLIVGKLITWIGLLVTAFAKLKVATLWMVANPTIASFIAFSAIIVATIVAVMALINAYREYKKAQDDLRASEEGIAWQEENIRKQYGMSMEEFHKYARERIKAQGELKKSVESSFNAESFLSSVKTDKDAFGKLSSSEQVVALEKERLAIEQKIAELEKQGVNVVDLTDRKLAIEAQVGQIATRSLKEKEEALKLQEKMNDLVTKSLTPQEQINKLIQDRSAIEQQIKAAREGSEEQTALKEKAVEIESNLASAIDSRVAEIKAKQNEMADLSTPKFAGAVEVGSVDAYKAKINSDKNGLDINKNTKETVEQIKQLKEIQQQQITLLAGMQTAADVEIANF